MRKIVQAHYRRYKDHKVLVRHYTRFVGTPKVKLKKGKALGKFDNPKAEKILKKLYADTDKLPGPFIRETVIHPLDKKNKHGEIVMKVTGPPTPKGNPILTLRAHYKLPKKSSHRAYTVFIEPELQEAVKKKRKRDFRSSKESGDEFIRSFNA